jgi:shikimate dehydrogenase
MNLGLIGYPLGHSLSPAMHIAALAHWSLVGSYTLLDTPYSELGKRIEEVRGLYRGVNVTIPHKEAVLEYMDQLSPEARAIGAVNTVVSKQGQLIGHNTDAAGFMRSLSEAGVEVKGKRVTLLGAGGAARAIVYALSQAGARVAIHNRSEGRAGRLAKDFGAAMIQGHHELTQSLRHTDVLVNATSLGLKDPLSSPIDQLNLPGHGVVVDIVYNPLETKLLRDAKAAGLKAIGGLPMLVWQGAHAFKLWTDLDAPIDLMFIAAQQALAEVEAA